MLLGHSAVLVGEARGLIHVYLAANYHLGAVVGRDDQGVHVGGPGLSQEDAIFNPLLLERDVHIQHPVFASILHDDVEVALLRDVPLYHEVLDVLQRDDLGLVLRKLETHEPLEELAEDRLQ